MPVWSAPLKPTGFTRSTITSEPHLVFLSYLPGRNLGPSTATLDSESADRDPGGSCCQTAASAV